MSSSCSVASIGCCFCRSSCAALNRDRSSWAERLRYHHDTNASVWSGVWSCNLQPRLQCYTPSPALVFAFHMRLHLGHALWQSVTRLGWTTPYQDLEPNAEQFMRCVAFCGEGEGCGGGLDEVCLVALASHELMNSLSPVAGCAGDHLAIWACECVSAMGRPQRRGNGGHDTDKPLAAPAAAYPLTSLPRGAREQHKLSVGSCCQGRRLLRPVLPRSSRIEAAAALMPHKGKEWEYRRGQ